MSEQFEMIAKTFQGLEDILAEELTTLGANDIQIGRRMVSFTGDKRMMYKANFCLRTAIRILKPIKNFTAKDADEVYNEIQAIPWEEYLDVNKTFAIDAVVFSEEFRHSKFVSYKVKDAIVDYFSEKIEKNKLESKEIDDWIANIRVELKKNVIRKQNRDINNREIYSYLHDIFGAEVLDLFDIEYDDPMVFNANNANTDNANNENKGN